MELRTSTDISVMDRAKIQAQVLLEHYIASRYCTLGAISLP